MPPAGNQSDGKGNDTLEKCKKAVEFMTSRRKLSQKDAAEKAGVEVYTLNR